MAVKTNPCNVDVTKKINVHNNSRYSDDGVQLIHDTVNPEVLMAAFTIGLHRTIMFEWMTKAALGGKSVGSWL